MTKFLVHIHTGPENPTKAALGLLVAAAALKEGHSADVFLAGDAIFLFRPDHLDAVEGIGTGRVKDHCQAITEGGGRFYLSGMSAKARGLGPEILADKPAEFAMPDVLVRLAAEADVVLTY